MSYIKLTGKLDVFAYILYGIAFYLGLLFLFQIKRFFSGPFFYFMVGISLPKCSDYECYFSNV